MSTRIVSEGGFIYLDMLALKGSFANVVKIAETINELYKGAAVALDAMTVSVEVPTDLPEASHVAYLSSVLEREIEPASFARVVVNERTGVIVMGEDVRISQGAITKGNLTVTISETPEASQPGPLSGGSTETLPRTSIQLEGGRSRAHGDQRSGQPPAGRRGSQRPRSHAERHDPDPAVDVAVRDAPRRNHGDVMNDISNMNGALEARAAQFAAAGATSSDLAQSARNSDEGAADAFESYFARMLVSELRKSLPNGFFSGSGSDVYGSWFDEKIGESLTRGDALGISKMVRTSLERTAGTISAPPSELERRAAFEGTAPGASSASTTSSEEASR